MKEIIGLSDDESTSSASSRKNSGLNDGDAPIDDIKRKRNEKEEEDISTKMLLPLSKIKKEDAIAPIVKDTVNETNREVKFSIGTLHHVTAHNHSTVNIQSSHCRTNNNINHHRNMLKNDIGSNTNHFNDFITDDQVPISGSIDFDFRIRRKTNTATIIDIIHNNDNVGAMNNGITISIVCGDNNINGMTNATKQS